MTSQSAREWLRSWNALEFLSEQRTLGRSNLPASRVAKYARDHQRVGDLLLRESLGVQDMRLARMLEAITAPLAALNDERIPRYYSYTGLNVLDQYIDGERLDLDMQKKLCVEGIRGLMLELARFELHALIGIEPWSMERFDQDICVQRLKLLKRQFNALESIAALLQAPLPPVQMSAPRLFSTLEGFCHEEGLLSAMVQFTCIPSSCSHDEVLFLRTIAENELCFKAIYLAVRQAGEAIERELLDAAVLFIDQAAAFAVMLHESFRVLQSMPPEHFIDFREVTGQASAVQSFNYQRLDIALFGLSPEKIGMLRRIPHLNSLLAFGSREFASLSSLLHSLPAPGRLQDRLMESARLLDRHLLSWRGLHLSFALRYLPPETVGTGGTSGASYLQKFFRKSLFHDTEPDFTLIAEIFGGSLKIEEIFRALPGTRVSPAEHLWMPSVASASSEK